MADGSRVGTSILLPNHRAAVSFAVQRVHPSRRPPKKGPWSGRDEPSWHDSSIFLRLINAAGCSNAFGVNAAFSIGSQALPHLTTSRNFAAHRGEETAKKLRRLSTHYRLPPPPDPFELVVSRAAGRPQSVLEDWIDDLQAIALLLPV